MNNPLKRHPTNVSAAFYALSYSVKLFIDLTSYMRDLCEQTEAEKTEVFMMSRHVTW